MEGGSGKGLSDDRSRCSIPGKKVSDCSDRLPPRNHSRKVAPPGAIQVPPNTAPCTLLYIEDNASNLRLVERIPARRPEITLLSAGEGTRGLELARQHHPDLIMLDLHLPDMQGDEILRHLRADPHTAAIPIVMISADATTAQIARLCAAGASDYLTKPIDVRQFLTLVDSTESHVTGEAPSVDLGS